MTNATTLREWFDEALQREPAERAAFVAGCADADLRQRLERLLAADERDGDIVGGNAQAVAGKLAETDWLRRLPPGTRIGPFELLAVLGEGGSSTVFHAARQIEGVRQEVALKLLRRGLYTPDAQRQFRRERLALAQLQHPGIAHLIEGGVTDTGLAYIALELVDGRPIADYAREHRLDVPARLALFLKVCRAVEAAHRALIVHRDLKPSNVLVTADGEVKLLDFGIAKLLESEDETQTRLPAFTPAYAAPEQKSGGAITTATDVYALGVLLGELMTGARLHGGHTPSSEVDEHLEPGVLPAPPHTTRRLLRGDLDTIVMKALDEDPARRYASAGAFADDVERLLDGRPVAAHPPSRWYRARKFVVRHKGGVATTCAFLLAVFAALGVALWQAQVARANAEVARANARMAQAHATRAEAVRQFMVGVFGSAGLDASGGKPITAQELLAKGSRQVEAGLRGEPALEADVLTLLGQLNIEISDFDAARKLFERALAASERSGVPTEVHVRALTGMASIEMETGAYDAALDDARQALALLEHEELPDAADLANAHRILAQALVGKGDLAGIEATLRANLAQDEAALGRGNEYVADQWLALGVLLGGSGRFDESERAFRIAIDGYREGFGENSNRVAHALNEYSNMLDDKGDLAGSEAALRRALAIREATAGPDHHDTITVANNLIYVLEEEGRYAEALPQRLAILDRAARTGTLHDRDISATLNGIGRDYRELGRFDESLAALRKSLDVATRSQGLRSSWRATALGQIAATQLQAGRFAQAETAAREAVSIIEAVEPAGSQWLVMQRRMLGTILLRQRRDAEALSELTQAAAALQPTIAAGDSSRSDVLAELSQAQIATGAHAEALATARSAVEHARRAFAPGHSKLGAPLYALGRAHLALGDAAAAEPVLREALAVRSTHQRPADLGVLGVKIALATALRAQGRSGEASAMEGEIRPLLRASTSPYARELEARLHAK